MTEAKQILDSCRLGRYPLFFVGTFTSGVTVLSQQTRALNLAWAFIEKRLISCRTVASVRKQKVAVIGAGFAGLTFAAALLEKGADADISIFEELDTLLPLQQGSDSRWLHPHIYDWPSENSEFSAAMLPILNWTAARASDVTVQILSEWKRIATGNTRKITLFCNSQHLQVHEIVGDQTRVTIEWVGERRNPIDGTMSAEPQMKAAGNSESFDFVVLAIGFGLERAGTRSYWRNEIFGQPALEQPRKTFLVSGQGDGALIDLLRLRISQYRQDRILDEIFSDKQGLLAELRELHNTISTKSPPPNVFAQFERLGLHNRSTEEQFKNACDELRQRLRRDTEAILHIRQPNFSKLFDPTYARSSFQNKLLVYMLYKCGAFIPSAERQKAIIARHSIKKDCVIRRHGTRKKYQFKRMLSERLYTEFKQRYNKNASISLSDRQAWLGGYFGFIGPDADSRGLPDIQKKTWRKEYLPGATALVASAFCASLSGTLARSHPKDKRLRITLHRAITLGREEVLQQSCEYFGLGLSAEPTSARTFPAANATIGLAYSSRKIVRSKRGVSTTKLSAAMDALNLNYASSAMSTEVGFVLAIPLLQPETNFRTPSPAFGIIYIDSTARNYFIADDELQDVVAISGKFIEGLVKQHRDAFGRVRNFPLTSIANATTRPQGIPERVKGALEIVRGIAPPRSAEPLQLNYDYSDFAPTQSEP